MKSKACISIKDDVESVFAALKPELKHAVGDRASFSISKRKGLLVIDITAEDSVALRAALNGIAKLLVVYEKTKVIQHGSSDKRTPGKDAEDAGN